MNKGAVASGIICGILGIVAGGGGVFLYFKKIHDRYNKELDESRETIRKLQEQKVDENDRLKTQIMLPSENEYAEKIKEQLVRVALNDIVEDEDPPEAHQIRPEEFESKDNEPEVEINDEIRFIGPKDYEDDDDYEKEVIKYYTKDDTLVQDDKIVERSEFNDNCGSLTLTSFGKFGAPSNEVYVRNEHFMVDYKIKRYNLSYERYRNGMS